MKTTLVLGAALAAAIVAFQPAPAQAQRGAWVAGAVIGAAGAAIVGSAIANSYGYGYGPVYVERRCWRERQAVYNRWGEFRGYRLVRVCG